MNYFEVRHTVGFEETNLVGNVYYVNYLRWQGRCRELFLKQWAPEVLDALRFDGLKLFTISCSCDYIAEATAFDEILVRMTLEELTQTQIEFSFDYFRENHDGPERLARGKQRIACMRTKDGVVKPAMVPDGLRAALRNFESGEPK